MVRRLVSYEYSPSAKVRLTCGGRTFRTSLFLSDGYCVLCRRSRVHGRARLSPVSAWSAPLALQAGAEWLRCVTSESAPLPFGLCRTWFSHTAVQASVQSSVGGWRWCATVVVVPPAPCLVCMHSWS